MIHRQSLSIALLTAVFGYIFTLGSSTAHGQDIQSGDSSTYDVAATARQICPALPGSALPPVHLKTPFDESVSLQEIVASKPTVLIVYRGGWCPYCSRHLYEIQSIEEDLTELGFQIVGISPDRPSKLATVFEGDSLSYTLLSDTRLAAASALGLTFRVSEQTLDRYDRIGIDLEDASGEDHHLLPVPALFLVDTAGTIVYTYVNPNYRKRISASVVLAAARSMVRSTTGE